jgi:hypothetical protein
LLLVPERRVLLRVTGLLLPVTGLLLRVTRLRVL